MKYIINHSNDTAFNIALEEYAFKHLLNEDQIFLLWINKPSIIVGRHQNTVEEMLKTIHGHPTYSEVMYEAFADVLGMAIHSPKKK